MSTFRAVIDGFALKTALATIKPPTHKGYMPVLACVRVENVDHRHVRLTTTDLSITLETTVPASVIVPTEIGDACLVPYTGLTKLVSKGYTAKSSQPVSIEFCDVDPELADNVVIGFDPNGANATTDVVTLRTEPLSEWPKLTTEFTDGFSLDLDAVAEVAPFSSDDESRPILTGVLVRGGGVYACTDSYRLAVVRTDETDEHNDILLPRQFAALATKHGTGRVTAETGAGGRDLRVELDDVTLTTRIIEGEFPNFEGLIPTVSPFEISTDVGTLRDALTKVIARSAALRSESTPVRVENVPCTASDLRLRYSVQDSGEVIVPIPGLIRQVDDTDLSLVNFTDPPACVAFNPGYLSTILDGVGDDAHLSGVDHLKPWLAQWDTPLGAHTRLLMPVRVAD